MNAHRGFLPVLGHRLEFAHHRPARARGGGAPPLVFLHEGLGSLALWRHFPAAVVEATGCEAYVYSRYGYGQSDPLSGAPRRTDYLHVEAVSVLPELLVALKVTAPILIGHSDGASIALIHAASGFETRGIVAMAPHVHVEDVTIAGIEAARERYLASDDWRQALGKHHRDPDATFRGWNDTWLSPAFRDWDIRPLLPRIDCPLLLIQGEDDGYGTLDQLATIARGARGPAESIALAGVGHAPWKEAPDAVVAAIAEFVDRVAPRGRTAQAAGGGAG